MASHTEMGAWFDSKRANQFINIKNGPGVGLPLRKQPVVMARRYQQMGEWRNWQPQRS